MAKKYGNISYRHKGQVYKRSFMWDTVSGEVYRSHGERTSDERNHDLFVGRAVSHNDAKEMAFDDLKSTFT